MMKIFSTKDVSESNQSLWLLAFSPLIWVAHFLICYITAAIYCAKAGGPGVSLAPVRVTMAVVTVVALAGIGSIGMAGFRRQHYGRGEPPYDDDTEADRHRFLGLATVLLSGISAVAVIFVALTGLFFHDCR